MKVDLTITQDDILWVARKFSQTRFEDSLDVVPRLFNWIYENFLKRLLEAFSRGFTQGLVSELGRWIVRMGLAGLNVNKQTTTQDEIIKELQRRLKRLDALSLERLIARVREGDKSEKQLVAISRMYRDGLLKWTRGVLEREKVRKVGGYAFRLLSDVEHCRSCPRYANRVARFDVLPLPTEGCECRGNCKCTIYFFPTLNEAVEALARKRR